MPLVSDKAGWVRTVKKDNPYLGCSQNKGVKEMVLMAL